MAKRKKRASSFEAWVGTTASPAFVLDSDRHVVAFNHGCEQLTGWRSEEVLGETAHYASVSEIAGAAAVAASLCPPPQAFAGEEIMVPAQLIHKAGHGLPRRVHFFPLYDDRARLSGVLGLVLPLESRAAGVDIPVAQQLHAELAALRTTLRTRFGANTIVARSSAMKRVLAQIELTHQVNTFALLEGEVGTGKEHLARVIHFGGPGRSQRFIPLDCQRTSPEELDSVWNRLLESTHSGAAGANPQPGTLYLAEVQFLPRDLQSKIVAAYTPSDRTRIPALRLLAATTRGLKGPAAEGLLRPDFQALISPLTIELPPLCERGDDLPILAQHFLEEMNRQEVRQVAGFDDEVWPLFARYRWPGNLDELAEVIREARNRGTESHVRPSDLPFRFRTALEAQEQPPPKEFPPLLLDPLLEKLESRLIRLALERSRNNKSKAAQLLGINRARLLRRIDQLHLGLDNASRSITDPSSDDDLSVQPED